MLDGGLVLGHSVRWRSWARSVLDGGLGLGHSVRWWSWARSQC